MKRSFWVGAGDVIGILAFLMPFRVVGLLVETSIDAMGKPKINSRLLLLQASLNTIAVITLYTYGLVAICQGLVLAYILYFSVQTSFINSQLRGFAKALFTKIIKPFIASMLMYGAVHLASQVWESNDSVLDLLVLIVVGVLTYAVSILLLLSKQERDEIVSFIKL